jgi:hypothetical protein
MMRGKLVWLIVEDGWKMKIDTMNVNGCGAWVQNQPRITVSTMTSVMSVGGG